MSKAALKMLTPHRLRPSSLGELQHVLSLLCVGVSLSALYLGSPQELWWLFSLLAALWGVVLKRGWGGALFAKAPVIPALLLSAASVALNTSPEPLLSGLITLLSLLTAARLFSLHTGGSYRELLTLTFGHITLAANLEGGVGYGLLLILYMISVTMSLTINHLVLELGQRESGERLQRLIGSKRLLPKHLLLTTGLTATLLCSVALLLFFMLPRMGGRWFQSYERDQGRAGFSEEVSLGDVSEVLRGDEVAFRVRVSRPPLNLTWSIGGSLPEERAAGDALAELLPEEARYWVGRRLDRYEAGRWRQLEPNIATRFAPAFGSLEGDTHWLSAPVMTPKLKRRLLYQEVFMEERGHEALFALSEPLALIVPRARPPRPLMVTEDQALLYAWSGAFSYALLSLSSEPSEALQQPLSVYRAAAERLPRYAQLTHVPDELEGLLGAFARESARSARSPAEAAERLSDRLMSEYRYDLSELKPPPSPLGEPPQDPLLYFLFERRAGHCEYFSSALALSLRALGFPARVVTGYHGGQASPYGDHLTVYQRDAHAWVELWAGGDPLLPSSWARYDATPASEERRLEVSAWRAWREQVEFAWRRYVLGFEVQDQLKAIEALDEGSSRLARGLSSWWRDSHIRRGLLWLKSQAVEGLSSLGALALGGSRVWLARLGALILSLSLLSRLWRRQRARAQRSSSPQRELQGELIEARASLVALYRAAGYTLSDHLSSGELLESLQAQNAHALERLALWLKRYDEARFGRALHEQQGAERLSALQEGLHELQEALQEAQEAQEAQEKKSAVKG